MDIRKLLICILIFAIVSSQSLNDARLRDPMLVGLGKLTKAINYFGFSLFEDLTISVKRNVVICPYSLSNALGILHFGSAGQTEKELAQVLGYKSVGLTKDEAAQTFNMLSTKQLQSSNPKLYVFKAPSTIIVNRKNRVLPTFRRVVEALFQAPILVVDFVKSGEYLVQSVNDWVATQTQNKIREIIQDVDPDCDMIVLNAAYFKGVWKYKFSRAETKHGVFYNHGSRTEKKEVHMMHMLRVLNFHQDKDLSILELPFKGRNVSMIFLLPNELDGIGELLNRFSFDFFQDQIRWMSRTNVDVILPKFEIQFGGDLTGNLQALGVQTLFHPEKVDLSEMVRKNSVTFGNAVHKAVVSVTENGVEAAAATAIVTFKSMPNVDGMRHFHADHPFLFVIYERRIKMVLFMGLVMEL